MLVPMTLYLRQKPETHHRVAQDRGWDGGYEAAAGFCADASS